MKKHILLTLIILLSATGLWANNYEDAWKKVSEGDLDAAVALFKKAAEDPKYAADASASLLFLYNYGNRISDIKSYWKKLIEKGESPYAYYYAFWFHEAGLGEYGKKDPSQLSLLKGLIKDDETNGSIKAAAHYVEGIHHTMSSKFKNAWKSYENIGAVDEWQFVGPFENILGSGFDRDYDPITKPKADNVFKSTDNADIKWFSPPFKQYDQWVSTKSYITEGSAIVYAQSFVYSDKDQEVTLALGATGTFKVWVNDVLALSLNEERQSELDTYKRKVKLKKGYNRVLVQLGYYEYAYPNFMLRFVDDKYNPIPNLKYKSEYQNYTKGTESDLGEEIPHFAENFFEQKLEADADNPLNYLLLSETYFRANRIDQAKAVINKGLKKYPEDILLHAALTLCYSKSSNRTELLKEVDWLRKKTPNSELTLLLTLDEFLNEENYEDAAETLEKKIQLFGEDDQTLLYKIRLARENMSMEELLKLVKEGYRKYPENLRFVGMMYSIEKEVNKNPKAAIRVLEKFLKETYDYKLTATLIWDYMEMGDNNKALKILKNLYKYFPFETEFSAQLANYYFMTRDPQKSIEYIDAALAISPYNSNLWDTKALIYEQVNATEDAIQAMQKSLEYNPNQYDLRRKISNLQNEPTALDLLKEVDEYDEIKDSEVDEQKAEHDYYYVFNKRTTVLYEDGAREEHYSIAIRVLNEYGIDSWKEISIPYSYRQRLVIEKAEVVKKSGQKIAGERNSNSVVFTDLEEGDAIYVKYKLQNYYYSKAALYTSDRFYFNESVPVEYAVYNLIIENGMKVNYELLNSDLTADVRNSQYFKHYQWEMKDLEAIEDESLMPQQSDIGMVLHISTAPGWKEIASWYNSMSLPQAKMDFELHQLLEELFPEGAEAYSEEEKARTLYEYIVKNISYSSVSFRQSGLVPQKASKTYHTRLGDCKDVATLFATLAREMGLDAKLVLINTRNNGAKDLILPSLGFNHCIIQVDIDDKKQFLELTSSELPFGTIPYSLIGADILVIPEDDNDSNVEFTELRTEHKVADLLNNTQEISISGQTLNIKRKAVSHGTATLQVRSNYAKVDEKRQKKNMKNAIARSFNNPVEVEELKFEGLEELNDSVSYEVEFSVANEVIQIGDLQSFKIPFADVLVTAEPFSKEDRIYDVEYSMYEKIDRYEDKIIVEIPEGSNFENLPKDVSLSHLDFKYELKFKLIDDRHLEVYRSFVPMRRNFKKEEYKDLREFLNKVLAAESKYIAFK
jgi:tetratricopeptide (TPR) repeat protein